MTTPKKVHIKIQRYRPDEHEQFQFSEYEVQAKPGMTVNDALFTIKEKLDGSVTWRVSCRMGICGSCGMKINGRWMLACQTQLADLGADEIVLEPLPNYPIIRDLVPDLTELYVKHRKVKPFIIRDDLPSLRSQPENTCRLPSKWSAIFSLPIASCAGYAIQHARSSQLTRSSLDRRRLLRRSITMQIHVMRAPRLDSRSWTNRTGAGDAILQARAQPSAQEGWIQRLEFSFSAGTRLDIRSE